MKIEALFADEISGLAIIKILDRKAQSTMMLILKFTWNLAILNVINSGLETVIFDLNEMLGILDLRLISYYRIKQGTLQQNLSKYNTFESTDTLCEQFNRFIKILKKRKKFKKNIHI